MGGIAFSMTDPRGLNTPRMPRMVYRFVRDACPAALRRRFLAVGSPIEAPNKQDYGDVDVFVTWDSEQTPSNNFESIRQLLGAVHMRVVGLVNCDAQFSVPWPTQLAEPGYLSPSSEPRYCQIDLHIYKSIEDFQWNLWWYAHGDLKPMMRTILRPFDLVISMKGLFLRIAEADYGVTRVLITNEPSQALRIFGYDPNDPIWYDVFPSVAELFEHTAKCRFFPGFYGIELSDEDGRTMAGRRKILTLETGGNANSTDYLTARQVFRDWIAEFIPSCVDSYPKTPIQKDALRDEILAMFPNVRAEYLSALRKAKRHRQRSLVKRAIELSVPKTGHKCPLWHTLAHVSLAKIIIESDYNLGFAPTKELQTHNGLYDGEQVKIFVEGAWKLVGDAAWDHHCRASRGRSQLLEHHAGEITLEAERYWTQDQPEPEDNDERIRFPQSLGGFRQTFFWDSDMNDI